MQNNAQTPLFEITSTGNDILKILDISPSRKYDIEETVNCEKAYFNANSVVRSILENYPAPNELAYAFYYMGKITGHTTDSMGDETYAPDEELEESLKD